MTYHSIPHFITQDPNVLPVSSNLEKLVLLSSLQKAMEMKLTLHKEQTNPYENLHKPVTNKSSQHSQQNKN